MTLRKQMTWMIFMARPGKTKDGILVVNPGKGINQ